MMDHAWGNYVKHAWGKDELMPQSKSGRSWMNDKSFAGLRQILVCLVLLKEISKYYGLIRHTVYNGKHGGIQSC